jgi:U1 small nuclear ribonucleoprotein 70kDa
VSACLVSVSFAVNLYLLSATLALGHPWEDKRAEGNPYNTVFVGRLSYTTSEDRLKKEFAIYGPVEGVRVVRNKFTKKSRGYAFVEFKNEKDADCKLLT